MDVLKLRQHFPFIPGYSFFGFFLVFFFVCLFVFCRFIWFYFSPIVFSPKNCLSRNNIIFPYLLISCSFSDYISVSHFLSAFLSITRSVFVSIHLSFLTLSISLFLYLPLCSLSKYPPTPTFFLSSQKEKKTTAGEHSFISSLKSPFSSFLSFKTPLKNSHGLSFEMLQVQIQIDRF